MVIIPRGKTARLIVNTHLKHDAQKVYKKFIRFLLDILTVVPYCKMGARRCWHENG